MTVHEVVPAWRVRGFGAQDLEGELAKLARQVGFVEILPNAPSKPLIPSPGYP
jgi:hypothetical protein